MEPKHWVAASVLVVLWLAETYLPFFWQLESFRERFRHDARNLIMGAINAVLSVVAIATVIVWIDIWGESYHAGLLRQFTWPSWLSLIAAVILLDFWTYWWHRLNHAIPFLWRFHRMHHSDPAMDTTTGVRFHTGEMGVSLTQLVFYESLLLPVVLFHHSNVRLPKWLDFGLLVLVVSPAMHRVHHSHLREETNSNYGSLLPWWDWLFGSMRLRRDVENIQYGVDEFADKQWQTLPGMLRTPLGESELSGESRG